MTTFLSNLLKFFASPSNSSISKGLAKTAFENFPTIKKQPPVWFDPTISGILFTIRSGILTCGCWRIFKLVVKTLIDYLELYELTRIIMS